MSKNSVSDEERKQLKATTPPGVCAEEAEELSCFSQGVGHAVRRSISNRFSQIKGTVLEPFKQSPGRQLVLT